VVRKMTDKAGFMLKIQISSKLLRCGKIFLLAYHYICGAAKIFPRLAIWRTLHF
jgi:hypothetical protein